MKTEAHRRKMALRKAARAMRSAPPRWKMAMETSAAALCAGSLTEKKDRLRRELAAQSNPDGMAIAANQEPEHGQ